MGGSEVPPPPSRSVPPDDRGWTRGELAPRPVPRCATCATVAQPSGPLRRGPLHLRPLLPAPDRPGRDLGAHQRKEPGEDGAADAGVLVLRSDPHLLVA